MVWDFYFGDLAIDVGSICKCDIYLFEMYRGELYRDKYYSDKGNVFAIHITRSVQRIIEKKIIKEF